MSAALSMQMSLTFDNIECGDLAVPAVAGLAAYFMSLDQYSVQLLVPGSVARNVRDLIRSLAYARLPDQPMVIWNGIDSREIYCPVRRDVGSSGCPAQNTTLPITPPVTPIHNPPPHGTTTSVKSGSTPPSPSTLTGKHTSTVTPGSIPPLSSTTTDSTTPNGGYSLTFQMTISDHDGHKSTLSSLRTMSISWVGGASVALATNPPQALAVARMH